jgi:hypothetical protein
VGRALNGLELHPLLDIEFDSTALPPATTNTLPLPNADFENGSQGWTATADVITTAGSQPAHSGQGKAWLGGYGETHTDRLSRQITLPASANAIALTFFLHIETEEENPQAFDNLRIRVRGTNGQILATLGTFSNLDAAPGFTKQRFDLTPFRGRTIRLELEAREDPRLSTSFVVDDFVIVIEGP